MKFLCEKCGLESKSFEELAIHRQSNCAGGVYTTSADEVVEQPQPKPERAPWQDQPNMEERKDQPPQLVYRYTGYCQTCYSDIDTIELTGINDGLVVAAWCPKCKVTLDNKSVPLLVNKPKEGQDVQATNKQKALQRTDASDSTHRRSANKSKSRT